MYLLKPTIFVTKVDDNVLILDISKSEYFSLDKIASIIFSFIQEGKNVDYISRVITKEYDVSIEQVKNDIIAFCEKLVKDGLLQKNDTELEMECNSCSQK